MRLDELTFPEKSYSYDRQRLRDNRICIDRNHDGTYDIWGSVKGEQWLGVDALQAQCILLELLKRYPEGK